MSRIASVDARLQSDTFTVGTGYSATIEKQLVEEGDTVKRGDVLFKLRSPTLSEALRNHEVSQDSLLHQVDADGTVLIAASANGIVQSINYRQGAFVPANSEIAKINSENAMYVDGVFKLSPPDYAKLKNGNTVSVLLPDNAQVNGYVDSIKLETSDDKSRVYTIVKVRIDQSAINPIFTVGTPVEAKLHLNTTTLYDRLQNLVRSFTD